MSVRLLPRMHIIKNVSSLIGSTMRGIGRYFLKWDLKQMWNRCSSRPQLFQKRCFNKWTLLMSLWPKCICLSIEKRSSKRLPTTYAYITHMWRTIHTWQIWSIVCVLFTLYQHISTVLFRHPYRITYGFYIIPLYTIYPIPCTIVVIYIWENH